MRRLALVAALLLVGAAGCGDDGGSSSSPDDSSSSSGGGETAGACDLLTTEDVATLLGQEIEDGTGIDATGFDDACIWETVEPSAVVDDPINLTVAVAELTDELDASLDDALADPANRALELGDRSAHLCGLGADGSSCDQYDEVVVAVGDTYVQVDLGNYGYPGDFSEEQAQQITEDTAGQVVAAL